MRKPDIYTHYRKVRRYWGKLPSSSVLNLGVFVNKLRISAAGQESDCFLRIINSYQLQIDSIEELKKLRGLDSGEKLSPRDKIRATAGRVGFSIPNFADTATFDDKLTKDHFSFLHMPCRVEESSSSRIATSC